jgi:O-antigen ligase
MNDFYFSNNKIIKYIIYLIPFSLISGPFFPDLLMTISIFYFIYLSFKKKNFIYFKNKFNYFFLLFFSSISISTLLSQNIFISFESTIPFLRLIFFCMVINLFYFSDDNFFQKYKYFFIITILIIFFDSIFQYYFGFNVFLFEYHGDNLTSFFKDEKILGSFISRILPVMLALIFFKNKHFLPILKNKLMLLLLFNLSIFIIFLSDERVSLVNFFIFLTLIFSFNIFGLRKILFFNFFIFLLMIFTFNNNFLDLKVFDKTIKYSGYGSGKIFIFSDHHHLHYITAFKIFKDNKFFGSGPKQFRYLCDNDNYLSLPSDIYSDKYISKLSAPELSRLNSLNSCATHPHHTFIQLLSETGLSGFLIFLFFYISLIVYMFKINKKSSNYETKMILIFTILINFSPLMPSGNFFNNYLSIIYFIPISILYSLILKEYYDKSK